MELRPEQLVERINRQPLAPIYLIAGAEPLRVLEAADAVRQQARAEGITEREVFQVDHRDFAWSQVAASLQAPSLFSARRLLELRLPTGKPGKEGAALLIDFCNHPPADVHLLITADQWSRAHQGKWSACIAQTGVICVAWPIKPQELGRWIEQRLRRKGVQADAQAVQYLAQRVEGNLLAAAQEIDKLVLLADGQRLDSTRIHALVADSARYDVFRLSEITLSGQVAVLPRMLRGLRAEGATVPGLLPIVVRELLLLAELALLQRRGASLAEEMKRKGIWEARQAPFRHALQRHPAVQSWECLISMAAQVDAIAKGRANGEPWQALERLLLAVAYAPALSAFTTSPALEMEMRT